MLKNIVKILEKLKNFNVPLETQYEKKRVEKTALTFLLQLEQVWLNPILLVQKWNIIYFITTVSIWYFACLEQRQSAVSFSRIERHLKFEKRGGVLIRLIWAQCESRSRLFPKYKTFLTTTRSEHSNCHKGLFTRTKTAWEKNRSRQVVTRDEHLRREGTAPIHSTWNRKIRKTLSVWADYRNMSQDEVMLLFGRFIYGIPSNPVYSSERLKLLSGRGNLVSFFFILVDPKRMLLIERLCWI